LPQPTISRAHFGARPVPMGEHEARTGQRDEKCAIGMLPTWSPSSRTRRFRSEGNRSVR
jgi:hypothetical protein